MDDRIYPERPLAAVGAVVKDGEMVLLVKRSFEPGRGRWSIPGGLIELGENVRDAVKREVEEEVGLKVEVDELIDVVDNIVRDEDGRIKFHYVLIDFLTHIVGGELKASMEAPDVEWVSRERLRDYQVTRTALKLLAKIGFYKEA